MGVPADTSSAGVELVTVSGNSVPDRCKWNITLAVGGGCIVQNVYSSDYLYTYGTTISVSGSLGTEGTATYRSRAWRIAEYIRVAAYDLSQYTCFFRSDLVMGYTATIKYRKRPESALWATLSDFTYSGYDTSIEPTEDNIPDYSTMQIEFWDFETCIGRAANIVRARYVGATSHGSYLYLEFVPVEQIKGTIKTESFVVSCTPHQSYSVANTSICYAEDPERYEVGKEYVLILEKRMSVYYDQDRYLLIGDIYIPVEEISTSTMYGEANLSEFSAKAERIDMGYQQMSSYIAEISDTSLLGPLTVGTDYIRSEDVREISGESEYVFEVRILNSTGGSSYNNTDWFMCSVVNTWKGEPISSEIEVIFEADTVEIGREYMVLLDRIGDSTFYILSSKNSVYPVSDTESIAVIKDALNGDHVTE